MQSLIINSVPSIESGADVPGVCVSILHAATTLPLSPIYSIFRPSSCIQACLWSVGG